MATLLVLCLSLLTTGCWDRVELEDQLFPVALSIDRGENHIFRIGMRIPVVAHLKSGILGGMAQGERSMAVVAESNTVNQSIYVINPSMTRRVTFRHVRAIFVGEDLCKEGMNKIWLEILRNPDLRETAGVFVVPGRAEEVLVNSVYMEQTNPGEIAEGYLLLEKYMHLAPPIRLHQMLTRAGAIGVDAFAPVMAINRKVSRGEEGTSSGSAIAGHLPRVSGNKTEIAGTALFRADRLVGYLNVDETQALLALRGEMGKAYFTMPDPLGHRNYLMIRFQQENKPKHTATFGRDGPVVSVRLLFEGEILAGQEDFSDPDVRRQVEDAAAVYMEQKMRAVVQKALDWETDPFGFGLLFRNRFATWSDWQQYRWSSRLKDLKVNVSAKMRIRRTGLIFGPPPTLGE